MQFALVIVEVPDDAASREPDALSNLAREIQNADHLPPGAIKLFGINCYECSLYFGLHPLGFLVGKARERHLDTRTLFFEQEPAWIISKCQTNEPPVRMVSPTSERTF